MTTLCAVAGFILVGYLLSRLLRRNDVADVLWGLGFIALAGCQVFQAGGWEGLHFPARFATALVAVWGLRLSLYIGLRFVGKGEDVRYANWRKEWGTTEPWRAFLQVFLLQGLILGLIAGPVVYVIQNNPVATGPALVIGACLFILGLVFEAGGDAQMAAFKKNPANKGRPLTTGLWGLVRHPNYLGEILMWWGFYLIAADSGGWTTVYSPVLLTFLLNRVSGVTMIAKILEQRGPDYRAYMENTPALCPVSCSTLIAYLILLVALPALDFLWLGIFMNGFYIREAGSVARLANGQWDPVLWAAASVYVFLSLGLLIFAVSPRRTPLDAAVRGALFGVCVYTVYDFTNLALVKEWSAAMAAADIVWGAVLCATAAYLAAAGAASSGAVRFK